MKTRIHELKNNELDFLSTINVTKSISEKMKIMEEYLEKNGPTHALLKVLDDLILEEKKQTTISIPKSFLKNPLKKMRKKVISMLVEDRIQRSRELFILDLGNEFTQLAKNPQERTTPNFDAIMEDVDATIRYIAFDIITRDSLEASLQAVKRWISAMKKCLKANDLNSVFIIHQALGQPDIHRLLHSEPFANDYGKISEKYKKIIQQIEELTDPSQQYRAYKEYVDKIKEDNTAILYLVPYQASLILKKEQLALIEESSKTTEKIEFNKDTQTLIAKITSHQEKNKRLMETNPVNASSRTTIWEKCKEITPHQELISLKGYLQAAYELPNLLVEAKVRINILHVIKNDSFINQLTKEDAIEIIATLKLAKSYQLTATQAEKFNPDATLKAKIEEELNIQRKKDRQLKKTESRSNFLESESKYNNSIKCRRNKEIEFHVELQVALLLKQKESAENAKNEINNIKDDKPELKPIKSYATISISDPKEKTTRERLGFFLPSSNGNTNDDSFPQNKRNSETEYN